VAYDRENEMVTSAAGSTWSIKDDKYEERCEFSTEGFPDGRGRSFAYQFKIDGDRWSLNSRPAVGHRDDEIWPRVK